MAIKNIWQDALENLEKIEFYTKNMDIVEESM